MNLHNQRVERRICQDCAATVSAVVAVGTAAYGAYSSYSASQKTKEQIDEVNSNKESLYGSKFQPVAYDDRIGADDSFSLRDETSGNLTESLPQLFDIADRVNAETNKDRQKRTGKAFNQTIRQEGANILAMERGQVPSDVAANIQRLVAENLGGSFDPSQPGGGLGNSGASNDLARKLGLTSLDLMSKGMSYAPEWRKNVDSFIYKPQDVMRDFWTPMSTIAADSAAIQLKRDENEYVSANNLARAGAMPDPQATGSFRDSMLLGTLKAQQDKNTADTLLGLVNSGAAAYATVKSPTSTSLSATKGVPVNTGSWRTNAGGVYRS